MRTSLHQIRRLYVACATALLLIAVCSPTLLADDNSKLQKKSDEIMQSVNRSFGLALSVLKQMKQLDTDYRSPGGQPIVARKGEAQQIVGKSRLLIDAFEANNSEIDKLVSTFDREASKGKADESLVSQLKNKHSAMLTKLQKYRRAVPSHFNKAVRDFGEPVAMTSGMTGLSGGQTVNVSGDVTAMVGTSRYKRPNTNPLVSASSTDIGFNVKGLLVPSEKINVNFKLGHKSTVQRREIGLTNMGASVVGYITPDLSATAGLDWSKYSDKDNDFASYSEFGLFGKARYNSPTMRVNAEVRRTGRSYSDNQIIGFAALDPSYSTTMFNGNMGLPFGTGDITFQLRYLKKSNEIDMLDHSDFTPSVVWRLSPNGTELGASYQMLSHPNVDDSPADVSRLKAFLKANSRSASGTKSYGPEVIMYKYPNLDKQDYFDLRFVYNGQARGNGYATTRFVLMYRLAGEEGQHDFAQLEWRKQSRPMGAGSYSRRELAVRYYTEQSDKDDPFRLANLAPAHTVDVYYGFGWMSSSTGSLQSLSIGPLFSGHMEIEPDRDDVFGDVYDVDYVMQHPNNTIRAGMEARVRMLFGQGVVFTGDARYSHGFMYNVDPVRSTGILEFKTAVTYPVSPQVMADGYLNMHRTRASTDSAADLNKSGFGVQIRYLFDMER